MSKLGQYLRADETGRRKLGHVQFNTVIVSEKVSEIKPIDLSVYKEYRICVEFRVLGHASSAKELSRLIEHSKKQIIHEVFGEFIRPMHMLRNALYNMDFDAARSILDELEKEMFE